MLKNVFNLVYINYTLRNQFCLFFFLRKGAYQVLKSICPGPNCLLNIIRSREKDISLLCVSMFLWKTCQCTIYMGLLEPFVGNSLHLGTPHTECTDLRRDARYLSETARRSFGWNGSREGSLGGILAWDNQGLNWNVLALFWLKY
jgi:hypothetical protein